MTRLLSPARRSSPAWPRTLLAALLPLLSAALRAPLLLTLLLAPGVAAPAAATPADDSLLQVQSTEITLLRALVEQKVITAQSARAMLRAAGLNPDRLDAAEAVAAAPAPSPAPATAPAAGGDATAPPPASLLLAPGARQQLLDEVKQEVQAQARAENRAVPTAVPAWAQRLNFSGDIRLRYVRNAFAADNVDDALLNGVLPAGPHSAALATAQAIDGWYQLPPGTTVNALDSHELLQLRVGVNVDARVNDSLLAAVRLVAAGANDATSSPVDYDITLGRYGRPYSAAVSLAYLQWQAWPQFELLAGRMRNPYFKSDLIFAPDLSLDGVALGYRPRYTPRWGAFVEAGAHPLQTSQSGPFNGAAGQWLYAAQAGADWRGVDESRARLAAAYYDFANIQGKADPVMPANNTLNDLSAPGFRQFGNTMFDIRYQVLNSGASAISPLYGYAAQFRLVNFSGDYEFARFDPLRLAVQLDWVRNVGFNATEIRQRIGGAIEGLPFVLGRHGIVKTGVDLARTNGYYVALRLGAAQVQARGDWQISGGVRYLQRDAVPDAFTSPDYRLGGTDNQAAFVGLNLGLARATALSLRYIAARSIDSGPKFGVDTWFLDLNASF